MLRRNIRRWFPGVALVASLFVLALGLTGAAPKQQGEGVPPQPFGANFFSGKVTIQGETAPEGLQLIACIDDCGSVFQSEAVPVLGDGGYSFLLVNPDDTDLVGRDITYFAVNQFGRIEADATRRFEGDFNIYELDLNFSDPLPTLVAPAVKAPVSVTLNPPSGVATAVTGTGFEPNSTVSVTYAGTQLGMADTDAVGDFRIVVGAPSVEAGEYEITADDGVGASASGMLTVPNLRGADGLEGPTGAVGRQGRDGPPGAPGPAGADGWDTSIVVDVVALTLAGLTIIGVVLMYLYLSSRFKELARRLPPPGIR